VERTWLCPSELDRHRIFQSSAGVRRARGIGAAAIGLALVASGPLIGWWLLVPFAAAALNLATIDARLRRSARPERVVARSLLFTFSQIVWVVAGTGGPASPFLPLLVIPAAQTAVRFRAAVVVAALGITAAVLAGMCFLVDAQATLDQPAAPIAVIALLVNVVAIVSSLQAAEIRHRDDASVDPLTGLLNRTGLEARFRELSDQAAFGGGDLCVLLVDVDEFKRINDTEGHDRGDAVLRALADELRVELRAFELVYRLGGEEFLVVLRDVELSAGAAIAERLRRRVEAAPLAGCAVTISIGVSGAHGEGVDWERLYRQADEALYAAKAGGRNVVRVAGPVHEAVFRDVLEGGDPRPAFAY
jgi:diguanylate cyclase (GGDEF)-like protein